MTTTRKAKMPESVLVGALRYTVSTDPAGFLLVQVPEGDTLYGLTDKSELVIYLNPVCGQDRQKQTLMHEVIHAAWDEAQLDGGKHDEEKIATFLGPMLTRVIRDNPSLIAWLTS